MGFDLSRLIAIRMLRSRRSTFYRDLAAALADQAVPLARFEKQRAMLARERSPLVPAYNLIIGRLAAGQPLASSFRGIMPESDLMVLSAIESDIAGGMNSLADAVEVENEIRGMLIGACLMPVFVMLLTLAIMTGVTVILAPLLDTIIRRDQWSSLGQIAAVLIDLQRNTWWFMTPLCIAAAAGCVWSLPRWTGAGRAWCDKWIPIYSVYRNFNSAKFLISLATMMRGTVSLRPALQTMQSKASPWMRWHIAKMLKKLATEANALRALDTGLFSRDIVWRLTDYGERAEPSVAIQKIGLNSIDTIKKSVKASSVVLNNLMMAGAGVIFVIVVGGMMTTMFGIGDAMDPSKQNKSAPK